ncbi:MAG: hemolysin family protein [Planctomycetota bacterium]
MTAGWWLVIGIGFLFVAGLFSTLVVCLHKFSRGRLGRMSEALASGAAQRRMQAIIDEPYEHAAAMSMLRIPFQLLAGIAIVMFASGMREEANPTWVAALIGVAIAGPMIWLFNGVIAQSVAHHGPEKTIARFARPIRLTHTLLGPIKLIVRFVDEIARRLIKADDENEDNGIDSELLSVVTEREREGHIDEAERDMLEAVVEFRSTTVEQIMTPRTEIDALAYTDDLGAVKAFIDEHGHSRAPVYDEDLDHVVGILYAKDLLRWMLSHGGNGTPFVLRSILRSASFVPETKTVRELLTQLLTEKVHIAMVADEYGGTSGLVTMEDIVEEIFGDIQDEYEDAADVIGGVEIDPATNSAVIDARTPIDDTNDELETMGIALPESDDYDTVGGFVSTTLGRIPDAGETFEHERTRVDVLEAEPTRVLRVRVTHAPDRDSDLDASGK